MTIRLIRYKYSRAQLAVKAFRVDKKINGLSTLIVKTNTLSHIILPSIRGEYRFNYNIAHLTWFKVGGAADIFYKPEDVSDLRAFLQQNQRLNLPITIIGAGSNVIIRDSGIEGVLIKLGRNFTNIELNQNNELAVGAGCLNFSLAKFCQENSIQGFEFLVGIPGTIGGGIAMNAGAYGREFKDIVLRVEALDREGGVKIFTNEEIGFLHRRNSLPDGLIYTKIIFKAELGDKGKITDRMNEISALREATQPVKEKTGGSTFVNPEGIKAWQLIDQAGMRGKKWGGSMISELHCNFMINTGIATATELEDLGELVRQEVQKISGYELKWEIKRIGRR